MNDVNRLPFTIYRILMPTKKTIILNLCLTVIVVLLGGILFLNMMNKRLVAMTWTIKSTAAQAKIDEKKSALWLFENQMIDTISEASKSVVSIMISKDMKFYMEDPSNVYGPGTVQDQLAKVGWWSGILVSKDGYIITNKHVVEDKSAQYSVVLNDGSTYNVSKIWFDDNLDIAILKIVDAKWDPVIDLPSAAIVSMQDEVKIGQFAIAIGNSLSEYQNSVTMGIISARNRELKINQGKNLYIWLFQTDTPINAGNSGGPLLDIYGNVIGINTAISEAWQWIAFALPITREFVDASLKSIQQFDKIVRPLIGIAYVDITKNIQTQLKLKIENGVYIKDVFADLPAAVAGFKQWDIIVAIDERPVNQKTPFLYQIYTYNPDTAISLTVIRNGETIDIPITLGQNAN